MKQKSKFNWKLHEDQSSEILSEHFYFQIKVVSFSAFMIYVWWGLSV